MTILITGASGFIGQALAASFDTGDDVVLVDARDPVNTHGHRHVRCDLRDPNSVDGLPDADTVYHLCAHNNTSHFYTMPFTVADNSLTPTINLLRRYSGSSRFIYSSSSEVYAGAINRGLAPIPTPELDSAIVDGIGNVRWSYAGSKLMGEILVHAAHAEMGMRYLILRYHNVYGPGQSGHFIPEYAERLRRGDDTLPGSDQTRAFLYIGDAVRITRSLADKAANDTINIGSTVETTISDAAAAIRRLVGVDREPLPVQAPRGSVDRRLADVSKMLDLIGGFDFTDLETGLAETLRAEVTPPAC